MVGILQLGLIQTHLQQDKFHVFLVGLKKSSQFNVN